MSSLCDKCGLPGGRSRRLHKCEPTTAIWPMIEALRADEGNSVTLLSDNPDGDQAVECCGDWTNWADRCFTGKTMFRALEAAHTALTMQRKG